MGRGSTRLSSTSEDVQGAGARAGDRVRGLSFVDPFDPHLFCGFEHFLSSQPTAMNT